MKKFEEELNNGLVSIGQNIITKEYAYGKCALINYFKDWISPEDHQAEINKLKSQLEKQRPEIPEVPQFVADWLEYCKEMQVSLYFAVTYFIKVDSGKITEGSSSHDDYGFGVSEENSKLVREWFTRDVHNQEKLALAFTTNFYTVAKEKQFYLKHIDMSKKYNSTVCVLAHGEGDVIYGHYEFPVGVFPSESDYIFTQSQIDSMETGSYEQIEVQ